MKLDTSNRRQECISDIFHIDFSHAQWNAIQASHMYFTFRDKDCRYAIDRKLGSLLGGFVRIFWKNAATALIRSSIRIKRGRYASDNGFAKFLNQTDYFLNRAAVSATRLPNSLAVSRSPGNGPSSGDESDGLCAITPADEPR
jgi:hypothetical protein